ncbi:MAG TPA: ATP-binding protein [Xanthobacteraceae bacterium]|jgi:two-component system osmolarity sensor histidine kinase EnvZ|nr:ATP-binding protein [Xanthobacteraceae bacterium]
MTSLDAGIGRLRNAASQLMAAANAVAGAGATVVRPVVGPLTQPWDRFGRWLKSVMPKGLYARSLLIIIVPMVVLQSVVALLFLERHWNLVTTYLSSAVTQEIATLIDVYKTYPQDPNHTQLRRIAQDRLGLVVDFMPGTQLPPPGPKPFFNQLDAALSDQIRKQIGLPFWIDTVGRSSIVEIRIELPDSNIMRVFAQRADVYDPNSWIFLLWMVATSLVVLAIAIAFLRNQIRPIVRLADAAEAFGKGREAQNFRPRGAREVRRAAAAFLEMKGRVERAIEQRTTMLAGVSHDLRTILTRFKLELALIGDGPEIDAIKKDIDEMAGMLEAYLAFARGDTGEQSAPTDIAALLDELKLDTERHGHRASATFYGQPEVTVRPAAFKRCLANLVGNASRFASTVAITGHRDHRWLTVTVDDDGPGIPANLRDDVFKPFLRLDDARNQDEGGTGLGLAIARDIARSHGGDITLGDSPLGGLRASVRIPV